MTAAARTPLATRPRRARVQRPPTPRSAARTLRRTASPTTGHTWTRAGLPGHARASAGIPWSESAGSLAAVALLLLPVWVWTQGAAWVPLAGGLALAVASYLLWVRRVVVGDRYVAVRQLGRYHVATLDHVRHLELRPSQRGGVLCLHTDDGRSMWLRRAEVAVPAVNAALRALADGAEGTRDTLCEQLLELPPEQTRTRAGHVADAER